MNQCFRFTIRDSQQPISPMGFLFSKLPPPPCAVLLVALPNYTYMSRRGETEFETWETANTMEFMVIVHLYSGGRTGTYQMGLLPFFTTIFRHLGVFWSRCFFVAAASGCESSKVFFYSSFFGSGIVCSMAGGGKYSPSDGIGPVYGPCNTCRSFFWVVGSWVNMIFDGISWTRMGPLVLIRKNLVLEGWPSKIEVSWVL